MSLQDLKTEYRGHTIQWSDNRDMWTCSDFQFDHASLAKVREHINKQYLNLRKAAAVPVLIIPLRLGGKPEVTEGTAIEWLGKQRYKDQEQVAVMAAWRHNDNKRSRSSQDLKDLYRPGPEFDAQMVHVLAAYKAVQEAERTLKAEQGKLPKITHDDLAGLIKAGATQLEGE